MSSRSPNVCDQILENARVLADAVVLEGVDTEEAEIVDSFARSVRTWANEMVDSYAIDNASRIPKSVLESAAELGLFGLTVPAELDGAGLSMTAACRIVEEIATFDRSVGTCIGLHCGLGLRGLVRYASEDLQKRYLPKLATGQMIAAFAATEAGAGSHIANVKTTAAPGDNGNLTLNGEKIYVTNGGFADVFTIVARTPGLGGARKGWSLLVIDRDTPGLSVGKEEHKLGIKASSTTTLAFDDVVVTPDRIIGEPGKGLELFHQILSWGRTLMSAGCLGTAKVAYKQAIEQVTTRVQFGKPIGQFGQVKRSIANMRASIYAIESVVRLVTQIQDRLGVDISLESSVAKVLSSEGAWEVADESVQLHGGAGFLEETGVARALRDCRITRIFEGANDVLRFHLASAALTAKRQGDAPPPLAPSLVPELTDAAVRFDAMTERFDEAVAALRKQYGIRAFGHQVLLRGIAEAYIAHFTLLAVLLRTDGELRHQNRGNLDQLRRLTRLLVDQLEQRFDGGIEDSKQTDVESLVEEIAAIEYD